jgi:hypothetical protein
VIVDGNFNREQADYTMKHARMERRFINATNFSYRPANFVRDC